MNDRPTKRSKWKITENKPEKFILFISGAIKAYALVQWSTVMNYYFSNFSGFFLIGRWRKKQWHVMENELNLWWDFSFHSDTQTRRIDHDWNENISSISSWRNRNCRNLSSQSIIVKLFFIHRFQVHTNRFRITPMPEMNFWSIVNHHALFKWVSKFCTAFYGT